MIGPSKTTTAKDSDFQSEIAAVLLGHDIGSHFGRSEYGMKRLVDAAAFVDTRVIFRPSIVKARRLFYEGDAVGGIAVDLIRAHENKRGIRTMLPGGFQQDHRSQRVHFKIH